METQMKTKKKIWKPPSFEDFNVAYRNKKIKLDSEDFSGEKIQTIPSEASEPKKISELGVHSKKIEEVRNWIKQSVKERAPVLLVTGPAGSGKTATVKVSAKEEGMLVKEWINPMDKIEFKANSLIECDVYDKFSFSEAKQIDKFEEFIFQSSRFSSLFDEGGNTLIVIEDIPNFFLWRPSNFHDFLKKYQTHGKFPIVFIISDDQNLNLSNSLFPNSVKVKFSITSIKFNPVNHSCLVKNLKTVSELYCPEKVSSQFLEDISRNSNGDIRSATNYLLLLLRSDLQNLNRLSRKNKKNTVELRSENKSLAMKDCNVDFYHVMGRILHPKLRKDKEKEECSNPNQILLYDVKKLAETWKSSFLSVLHENYVQAYGSLTDVVGGAQCFSFCDVLQKHEDLEQYSSLIGVISLMLKNTKPKKTGFNHIKKPFQWNSINLTSNIGCDVGTAFCGSQPKRRDVHLDVIPFLKILSSNDEPSGGIKGFVPYMEDSGEESDEDAIEIEEFDD